MHDLHVSCRASMSARMLALCQVAVRITSGCRDNRTSVLLVLSFGIVAGADKHGFNRPVSPIATHFHTFALSPLHSACLHTYMTCLVVSHHTSVTPPSATVPMHFHTNFSAHFSTPARCHRNLSPFTTQHQPTYMYLSTPDTLVVLPWYEHAPFSSYQPQE